MISNFEDHTLILHILFFHTLLKSVCIYMDDIQFYDCICISKYTFLLLYIFIGSVFDIYMGHIKFFDHTDIWKHTISIVLKFFTVINLVFLFPAPFNIEIFIGCYEREAHLLVSSSIHGESCSYCSNGKVLYFKR